METRRGLWHSGLAGNRVFKHCGDWGSLKKDSDALSRGPHTSESGIAMLDA